MNRLYKGINRFKQQYFKKEEDYFKKISKGQSPDVLFITCCDSRLDPNLLTQSRPGELFIVKNVGSIVPPSDRYWKKTCVGAAIEFAVNVLRVTDVVVCGHSDCGALKALDREEKYFEEVPNLREWIDTARPVKKEAECAVHDPAYTARLETTAKMHIVAQLRNLGTYPAIDEALKAGKINVHGWYFDIGTGDVEVYNPMKDGFEAVRLEEEGSGEALFEEDPCEDVRN